MDGPANPGVTAFMTGTQPSGAKGSGPMDTTLDSGWTRARRSGANGHPPTGVICVPATRYKASHFSDKN